MKQIKIMDIFPDIYDDGLKAEKVDRLELHDKLLEETNGLVVLDHVFVPGGSVSIEDEFDSAMAVPYIVQEAKKAEEAGYDAIIIDCFLDPGLDACRELLSIPVLGACQSAVFYAARLGTEFSVLDILADCDRPIQQNINKYGLHQHLKSIISLDVPVLELHADIDKVVDRMITAAELAVTRDSAKAIVFGCTGLSPLIEKVKSGLKEKGLDLLIIEPMRAALFDAVSCAMMGISQSKHAYMPTRSKRRILDWTLNWEK